MFANALLVAASLSLATPVSVDQHALIRSDNAASMSEYQKQVRVSMSSILATECINQEVRRHVRPKRPISGLQLNELITEAMPQCVRAIHDLIHTYDTLYGGGGVEFILGPYLNQLPHTINKRLYARP
jgi:hypothetical protein